MKILAVVLAVAVTAGSEAMATDFVNLNAACTSVRVRSGFNRSLLGRFRNRNVIRQRIVVEPVVQKIVQQHVFQQQFVPTITAAPVVSSFAPLLSSYGGFSQSSYGYSGVNYPTGDLVSAIRAETAENEAVLAAAIEMIQAMKDRVANQ